MRHETHRDHYGRAILATPGLAGFWRLDERRGTVAFDSAGINHGVVTGSPTLGVAGVLAEGGTAVKFPTVSDYILIADANTLDLGNAPWSVEMWLAFPSGTAGYPITKGTQFNIRVQSNQVALDNEATGIAFISNGTATTDGLIHHWVIARSATGSGNTFIAKDGVVQAITETNAALTFASNATALNFGRYFGGGTGITNGVLQAVALYRRQLTAAEVATHYLIGKGA